MAFPGPLAAFLSRVERRQLGWTLVACSSTLDITRLRACKRSQGV